MPVDEITEQSSKEDVTAYAEQVVTEVEEERAGEQKSDAQITSEHAGKPAQDETPAETESGSQTAGVDTDESEDTAEVEDQGEDTGDKGVSWLDDGLKAEMAAIGIEESELADFASRDEFYRALRLFDKSALDAGRKALAESEDNKGQTRDAKGKFRKAPEPKVDQPPDTGTKDGKYEITLANEELWDEDIATGVKEVASGLRDHFESRFAALEAQLAESRASFAEAESLAEEQRFDTAIDALDMQKLFGATGKETSDQLKKREDVLAQAKVIQAGYRSFGRDVEVDALVSRVAPMVFSSEFDKRKLKARTREISKQSNGRQGGGATRPQDPREDPRTEADRLYKEMDRN